MTHEELLAKIKGSSPHWKALRAVVELHKPQNKHEVEFGLAKCDGCYMPYPCPTIQAIKKELG